MTIEETNRLDEAVFSAALKLATHQHNIMRAERNYEQASEKRRASDAVLLETKNALKRAELRHAICLCAFLEHENIEKGTTKQRCKLESEHYRVLKALIAVCSSGDRAKILLAAHQFSACNAALNDAVDRDSEACVARAKAALSKGHADTFLETARKQFEAAETDQAEAKAAEELCWKLIPRLPRNQCPFQDAVADAAAALTGSIIRSAHQPFDQNDLGIKLPDDEVPAPAAPEPTSLSPTDETQDTSLNEDRFFRAQPCIDAK